MMIGESFAIVAVLLVTALMGLRAGKKSLAQITLPFLCVPASFLIGEALYLSLGARIPFRHGAVRLTSVLLGAMLGGALCVLAANYILPPKARLAFIVGCLLFILLMALAYILPILV